jgi:hypothetical protein
VYLHPAPAADMVEFIERAQVGVVPGIIVIIAGMVFNFSIFFIAFSTIRLRHSSSEVLPLEDFQWHPFKGMSDWAEGSLKRRNTIRRSKKARQRIRSIHKSEA